MDKRMYGVPDLLAMFPRSRTQLYRDMREGLLPYSQVGTRRYFEPTDIDRYINALKTERPAVEQLVDLIDDEGRIDVSAIPEGCTLADLDAVKRHLADRKAVA